MLVDGSVEWCSRRFAIGWAQLILATLLVTTFAHSYELVLLIVPAVILYAMHARPGPQAGASRRYLIPALAALYIAPFLVLLYRQHFVVPAMLTTFALLWWAAVSGDAAG